MGPLFLSQPRRARSSIELAICPQISKITGVGTHLKQFRQLCVYPATLGNTERAPTETSVSL
jgi:hypothetical protein